MASKTKIRRRLNILYSQQWLNKTITFSFPMNTLLEALMTRMRSAKNENIVQPSTKRCNMYKQTAPDHSCRCGLSAIRADIEGQNWGLLQCTEITTCHCPTKRLEHKEPNMPNRDQKTPHQIVYLYGMLNNATITVNRYLNVGLEWQREIGRGTS